MLELFIGMMKEEWRIHSTMFGSLSFAMFPVMIFGIAFMGSFLLPLMRTALPAGNLALVIHANFLMLGFMVGAFGLLAGEVMNRRFGQASLLVLRTKPAAPGAVHLSQFCDQGHGLLFLPVGIPLRSWIYRCVPVHRGNSAAGPPAPPHPDALVPFRPVRDIFPFCSLCPFKTCTLAARSRARCRVGNGSGGNRYKPGSLFPSAPALFVIYPGQSPRFMRNPYPPLRCVHHAFQP